MEIDAVLIFGGNGTQWLSHIITNRTFLRHEYVYMPYFLCRAMKSHSQEHQNHAHLFGHMNKVKKHRSKLPEQVLILPVWLLNGRNITTDRGSKELQFRTLQICRSISPKEVSYLLLSLFSRSSELLAGSAPVIINFKSCFVVLLPSNLNTVNESNLDIL